MTYIIMEFLPEELVLKNILELDYSDIQKVCTVNKRTREICQSNKEWIHSRLMDRDYSEIIDLNTYMYRLLHKASKFVVQPTKDEVVGNVKFLKFLAELGVVLVIDKNIIRELDFSVLIHSPLVPFMNQIDLYTHLFKAFYTSHTEQSIIISILDSMIKKYNGKKLEPKILNIALDNILGTSVYMYLLDKISSINTYTLYDALAIDEYAFVNVLLDKGIVEFTPRQRQEFKEANVSIPENILDRINCEMWLKNVGVNPETGDSLEPGHAKYIEYTKKCSDISRLRTVRTLH